MPPGTHSALPDARLASLLLHPLEVIVVDDHSRFQCADSRASRRPSRQTRANRGAAAARNTGARAARGGALLFLDSTSSPAQPRRGDPASLRRRQRVAATGCYAAEPANDTDFARYKALWTWYCWARSGGLVVVAPTFRVRWPPSAPPSSSSSRALTSRTAEKRRGLRVLRASASGRSGYPLR